MSRDLRQLSDQALRLAEREDLLQAAAQRKESEWCDKYAELERQHSELHPKSKALVAQIASLRTDKDESTSKAGTSSVEAGLLPEDVKRLQEQVKTLETIRDNNTSAYSKQQEQFEATKQELELRKEAAAIAVKKVEEIKQQVDELMEVRFTHSLLPMTDHSPTVRVHPSDSYRAGGIARPGECDASYATRGGARRDRAVTRGKSATRA